MNKEDVIHGLKTLAKQERKAQSLLTRPREAPQEFERWYIAEVLESAVLIIEQRDKALCELEMWKDGNIMHEFHRNEIQVLEQQRDRLAEELRTLIEERNEVCNQRDAAVELYNPAVVGAKLIDKDLKKSKINLKKVESERDKFEKGLKDLITYANTFKPLLNRCLKRQTAVEG
jgi:hypothetical protein